MDYRNILNNISIALIAQLASTLVSVLASLLVPKILGVADFGYWQLFMFYASYVGLFHLGLNDGVYLENGGLSRDVIDKSKINSELLFGLIYQALFSTVMLFLASTQAAGPERSFVIMMTAIFLIANNLASFLGYVFQAMNETKLYSYSVALNGIAFLVPLIALLVLGVADFRAYIIAFTVAKGIAVVYCFARYADFIPSGIQPLPSMAKLSLASIRVGIKLMVANIAGMLILGIARALVDSQWGIEAFGSFSLAVSIASFFTLFISQISMVLFPALRQTETDKMNSFMLAVSDAIDIVSPLIFLSYFVFAPLLTLWLPQYADCFTQLALLLPFCIFEGKMDVIGATYYKVTRQESRLLTINLCTLVLSAIGCLVCVFVLRSLNALSVWVAICAMGRYFVTERHIAGIVRARRDVQPLYLFLLAAAFAISIAFAPFWAACAITIILSIAFFAICRKQSMQLMRSTWRILGGSKRQ